MIGNKNFLLTGYLNKKIKDYFSDGDHYGWQIEYSNGPVYWGTAKEFGKQKQKLKIIFYYCIQIIF